LGVTRAGGIARCWPNRVGGGKLTFNGGGVSLTKLVAPWGLFLNSRGPLGGRGLG